MMWKTPNHKPSAFIKNFLKRERIGGAPASSEEGSENKTEGQDKQGAKDGAFVTDFLSPSLEEEEGPEVSLGVLGI